MEETRSGEMMCDPGVDEMRVRTKGVSRRSAPREANRLAFPSFLRLSKYLSTMQLGAPRLSDASITRGCFDTSATCCPNVLLSRLLGYGNVFVARSMRGSPCRMPDNLVCSMLVTIAVATIFFFLPLPTSITVGIDSEIMSRQNAGYRRTRRAIDDVDAS